MAIFGIHDFFLLVTVIFGFMLGGISILSGAKNRASSSFMAAFFFALATASLGRLIFWNPHFSELAHRYSAALTFFYVLACLTIGPALYLYIRSLAQTRFTLNYGHALHFAVPLLAAVGVLLSRGGVDHLTRVADPSSLLLYWAVAMLGVAPIGYTILSWLEVQKTKKLLSNFYSSTVDTGSNWLQLLVYGYFLVLLSALCIHFYSIFLQYGEGGVPRCFHSTNDMLTFGLLFVLFFYSSSAESRKLIKALPEAAPRNDESQNDELIADPRSVELQPDEQAQFKRQVVTQGIAEKKLHLDPNVNIERFAERVGLKPKEVSLYINTQLQCNFFEFINQYRVQEAQRLLIENRDQSVNEVMLSSGYTSTSSFFRAFKKLTGLSPSQYLSSASLVQAA